MTELFERAVKATRRLTPEEQDDIARIVLSLAGEADVAAPVDLSPAEGHAIARSKAAAAVGRFATDDEVDAVWAKHGLMNGT